MAKGGRSGGYSGGGRSSYGGSSRSYSVAPTPRPYFSRSSTTSKTTSSPTTTSSSSSGGFFDSITQGFGFGMGSSIGRNMIDGIMNRPVSLGSSYSSSTLTNTKENIVEKKTCEDLVKTFRECMTMNSTNFNICSQAYKEYNDCMTKKESK